MEHDRYLVQNKTIVTRTKAEFWGALTLASRVSHHRPRVPAMKGANRLRERPMRPQRCASIRPLFSA
jgi:hypothetical protein